MSSYSFRPPTLAFIRCPYSFLQDVTEELENSRHLSHWGTDFIARRLEKDAQLKEQYSAFMDEYLDLGNIEEVPPAEI